MSQIPVTAIDYGAPPSGQRRAAAQPVQRLGVNQSLGVYPQRATPPTPSSGLQLATELLSVMGVLGSTASQVGGIFAQQRFERERKNDKIKALYEGQANLDARSSLPELLTQENIDKLVADIPDGVSVQDYVAQLMSGRLDATDENGERIIPQSYADAYRNVVQPTLTSAIVSRNEQIRQDQQDSIALTARNSPDALAGYRAYRDQFPNVPEAAAINEILAPRLSTAARNGEAEEFNHIARTMSDAGWGGYVDDLRPTLDASVMANQAKKESDRRNIAKDSIDRIYNNAEQNGAPIYKGYVAGEINRLTENDPDLRRDMLDELDMRVSQQRGDARTAANDQMFALFNNNASISTLQVELGRLRPQMGEQDADQHKRRIDAMVAEQKREAQQRAAQAAIQQQQDYAVNFYRGIMDNAAATGGAAVVQDVPIYDPITGQVKKTITSKEIVDQLVGEKMSSIAQNVTPEQAVPLQLEYLSRNGATFDTFKKVGEAGWKAAATDLQSDAPPANAINGYKLWKQMGDVNPRLRQSHFGDDAQRFYKYAEAAEQYVTTGEENSALLYAMKAMDKSGDREGQRSRVPSLAMSSLKSWDRSWWPFYGGPDIKNVAEVDGAIVNLAEMYVDNLGLSAEDATEKAFADVAESHTMVNGFMVFTPGSRAKLPSNVEANLGAISDTVGNWYASRFGEEEGIDAGDIAIVPGPMPNTYQLYNMNALRPVERWREQKVGLMSGADLIDLWHAIEAAKDQDAKDKMIDDWNNTTKTSATQANMFMNFQWIAH